MKAKIEFLWYQAGDEIKEEDQEHIAKWAEEGFVEEEVIEVPIVKEDPDVVVTKKVAKKQVK